MQPRQIIIYFLPFGLKLEFWTPTAWIRHFNFVKDCKPEEIICKNSGKLFMQVFDKFA